MSSFDLVREEKERVAHELARNGRYLAAATELDGFKITDCNEEVKGFLNRADKIKQVIEQEERFGRDDSRWIYGTTHFGYTTHYQLSDSGTIVVRMEGMSNLALFEQCAVIHEVDLFQHWVPFCDESQLLEKIGPAELLM
jgi:hypothetical protein